MHEREARVMPAISGCGCLFCRGVSGCPFFLFIHVMWVVRCCCGAMIEGV